MQRISRYIYQKKDLPNFTWDINALFSIHSEARNLQGKLLGKMESLGFEFQTEAILDNYTLDVLKLSLIHI